MHWDTCPEWHQRYDGAIPRFRATCWDPGVGLSKTYRDRPLWDNPCAKASPRARGTDRKPGQSKRYFSLLFRFGLKSIHLKLDVVLALLSAPWWRQRLWKLLIWKCLVLPWRISTLVSWGWHLELRRGWNRTVLHIALKANDCPFGCRTTKWGTTEYHTWCTIWVHPSVSNRVFCITNFCNKKCLGMSMFTWMLPKDRTLFIVTNQGPISLHWGVWSALFGWISIVWSWAQPSSTVQTL